MTLLTVNSCEVNYGKVDQQEDAPTLIHYFRQLRFPSDKCIKLGLSYSVVASWRNFDAAWL